MNKEASDNQSLSSRLNVRPYVPSDGDAVRAICHAHFRSLSLPAVWHYVLEHSRDLISLVIIGKFFQPWKIIGIESLLFLIYLFIRARIEMELYIRSDCPDLSDIQNFYALQDPKSRSQFWIAEAPRTKSGDKKTNGKSGTDDQAKLIVGCVGCTPTADDPSVAQLVRLVVDEEARRMRVGSRLLAQFESFALEKGFKQVRLFTNNLNTSHIQFVRQRGYEVVHWISRSTVMRGSLIQWRKTLLPEAKGDAKDEATFTTARRRNSVAIMD